jgi:hypothetical protein
VDGGVFICGKSDFSRIVFFAAIVRAGRRIEQSTWTAPQCEPFIFDAATPAPQKARSWTSFTVLRTQS